MWVVAIAGATQLVASRAVQPTSAHVWLRTGTPATRAGSVGSARRTGTPRRGGPPDPRGPPGRAAPARGFARDDRLLPAVARPPGHGAVALPAAPGQFPRVRLRVRDLPQRGRGRRHPAAGQPDRLAAARHRHLPDPQRRKHRIRRPGPVHGARAAEPWRSSTGAGTWTFLLTAGLLFVWIPLLFPTGGLLGPRWRWFARAAAVAMAIGVTGDGRDPRCTTRATTGSVPDPLGAPTAFTDLIAILVALASQAIAICGLVAIASLGLRYRRAESIERAQSNGCCSPPAR